MGHISTSLTYYYIKRDIMKISGPISFYHLQKGNTNIYLFGDHHFSKSGTDTNYINIDLFLYNLFTKNKNTKFDMLNEIHENKTVGHSGFIQKIFNRFYPVTFIKKEDSYNKGYYSNNTHKNVYFHGCLPRNKHFTKLIKSFKINELSFIYLKHIQCSNDKHINNQKLLATQLQQFIIANGCNNIDDIVKLIKTDLFDNLELTDEIKYKTYNFADFLQNEIKFTKDINESIYKLNNNIMSMTDYCLVFNHLMILDFIMTDGFTLSKLLDDSSDNKILFYGNTHIENLMKYLTTEEEFKIITKSEPNIFNLNYRVVDVGNSFNHFKI
jgi:hypothetical protein